MDLFFIDEDVPMDVGVGALTVAYPVAVDSDGEDLKMPSARTSHVSSATAPQKHAAAPTPLSAAQSPLAANDGLGAFQAKAKRRTTKANNILKPVCVDQCSSRSIECIFLLEKHDKEPPVPLWPMYTATTSVGTNWVILGSNERWFSTWSSHVKHMCLGPTDDARKRKRDATSIGNAESGRQFSQKLLRAVREVFRTALLETRNKSNAEDDVLQLGADDDDDASSHCSDNVRHSRLRFTTTPEVTVKIGDASITMLNTVRPIVVKVDEFSVAFLSRTLPRLLNTQLGCETSSSAPADGTASHPTCGNRPTPNIREKVTWVPQQYAWRVELKKPRRRIAAYVDSNGATLRVEKMLPKIQFAAAKLDAYSRAISTWNDLDGSSRLRIPAPNVVSVSDCDSLGAVSTASSTP